MVRGDFVEAHVGTALAQRRKTLCQCCTDVLIWEGVVSNVNPLIAGAASIRVFSFY